MTDKEAQLLERELARARSYFEYGAGESTQRAVRTSSLERIVSVESDRAFVDEHLMPDPEIRANVESGRLEFVIADIGPTKRWGHPRDRSQRHKWPNYPDAIRASGREWDLVLVDGRFRVACVAAALVHCPGARVMVHDFWRRRRYRVLLKLCEVLEEADQLVVLGAGRKADAGALRALYGRYRFNPSDKTLWLRIQEKLGRKV
jgi:hypothetical protein